MTKDEQVFLHHMNDIASRSYYEGRPCFSDFMSMYEQDLLLKHQDDILKDTGAEGLFLSGGYPHAERVLAAFGAFEPEGGPLYGCISPPLILSSPLSPDTEIIWGVYWDLG